MSTSSKGTGFELRVLSHFRNWIEEGQTPFPPENCEIFHQKGYYSKDRGGSIKFDVSIEIRFPGRPDPAIIYIIECKDLNTQVSIADVEEFWAKLQQIGTS